MGRWSFVLAFALGIAARAHAAPEGIGGGPPTGAGPGAPIIVAPPPTAVPYPGPIGNVPPPTQVGVEVVPQTEQLAEAPIYPLRLARWRLAGVQGANGAGLGSEICALLHPTTENNRCAFLPFVLGGAVALTAGLAVRPGISSDHISAINGGTALAIWHGALIMGMTGLYWPDAETGRTVGGIVMIASAQTLGPLAGHFFYRLRPSRQGVVDAAVVTSLWSGMFAGMLVAGYADPTADRSNHPLQFGTMMLATEVGMGIGIGMGRNTHFSPYRALAVHGYAIGGGMVGVMVGLPILKSRDTSHRIDENDFWRLMAFGSLGGFVVGVATSAHLGEHANARIPISGISVTPVAGGGTASVSGRF